MSARPPVCLLGFGEVGRVLATDLGSGGGLSAWDVLFRDPASEPSRAAATDSIRTGRSAADALAGASVVISAVTAAECVSAAQVAADGIAPGAFYLDLNSVSPETKTLAARAIAARGGRYVEAAVMSPIRPKRIGSPILLGGPHAAEFLDTAHALGFSSAEVFSDVLGRASAAKMCRSVMIKGMEALLTESLLAARHYQVDATVLDSLGGLLPAADWPALARYMISRSLEHGGRRAEEMREVARTVADAGLDPWMSAACVERQRWAGARGETARLESLNALLDALLATSAPTPGAPRC